MQAISPNETIRLPHLSPEFGSFGPDDSTGLGGLPPGWFECPASWPIPTTYAVASGAGAAATLGGKDAAIRGVAGAVSRLAESSDLIIGDCGFFWAARDRAVFSAGPPVLLSGLELLELAGRGTESDVAVITFSAPALERLLAKHPMRPRLRFVGLSDMPSWSHLAAEDYGLSPGWSTEQLGTELTQRLTERLADGSLDGVGSIVVECTVVPQFRAALRELTRLPILDLREVALGFLLGSRQAVPTASTVATPVRNSKERTLDVKR